MADHAAGDAVLASIRVDGALTPQFPPPRTAEEILLGVTPPTQAEVDEAKRSAAEKAEWRRNFLSGLMSSVDFRAWLMNILIQWGTFDNAFGAGPTGFPDPMATQFQLGMKQAGWRLWTEFDDIAPDLTSLMRREWAKPQGEAPPRS